MALTFSTKSLVLTAKTKEIVVGAKFGRLEILSFQGKNKYYQTLWLCRCDCGIEKVIQSGHLKSGLQISCGCYNSEITDLVGQKFGRLEVTALHSKNKNVVIWLCRCSCGEEVPILGGSLTSGKTSSCGCYKKEATSKRFTTHGLRKTKTYKSWADMKQRCLNTNDPGFKHYGGRGIQVCERWLKFENFLEDMGECPDGMSIERKNNNGNYEKDNCKWATKDEQSHNRRNNVVLEHNGESKTVDQWAKEKGMSPFTMYRRLRLGWTPDRAITEPLNK